MRLVLFTAVWFAVLCPVLLGLEWEGDVGSRAGRELSVAVEFPKVADIFANVGPGIPRYISFLVKVPSDGPEDVKAAAFLKSKDGLWYQTLTKGPFPAGRWKKVTFNLAGGDGDVLPDNHFFVLNDYTSARMEVVGLKFFSTSTYRGPIHLRGAYVDTDKKSAAPRPLRILDLRRGNDRVDVLGLFELTFGFDRSFTNPFDPEEIEVKATFVSPSGKIRIVPGFCYRDFMRSRDEEGEILTPRGRQEWKVRFTPTEPGRQTFYLSARAGGKEIRSARNSFEAVPSDRKGFVRICRNDPNWFELTTGEFFYPIGHNVRSPTDPRCAKEFYGLEEPVSFGTFAYDRYLSQMAENGENVFEVWMSSWWLGLEWTKRWKTYYDIGHYSMENAWRLDYLVNLCDELDIYTHLVVDNHGKMSTFVDPEWKDNPYNVKNGGFLKNPEKFFSNEQAKKLHKKKLRYIVGRWAYSPRILGFELISEIDLTGESHKSFKRHPVKREWSREMIRYLNQIDPWEHLYTIHYSGNYRVIDPAMVKMREIDYIAVDAYREAKEGTVIPYILGVCEMGRRLKKPSLITEYGGNPWGFKSADKLARLEADLHTGIWAGFMSALSGTPFLWWFDYIEREDLYYHYSALANFCKGEDLRGLGLETERPGVQGVEGNKVRALALSNGKKAYLWTYDTAVTEIMPEEENSVEFKGVTVSLPMSGGEYIVEFWDTYRGFVIKTSRVKEEGGVLLINVPDFRRDIACKIIPADASGT